MKISVLSPPYILMFLYTQATAIEVLSAISGY